MAFFTSEYECKLDTKGRLVLPAKIKSSLPEVSTHELIIRKGFEQNLILYPMLEYKKIHAKIAALSEFNAEQRKLKRNFFRSIQQVDLDSAGRLLIPRQMLAHAGLDKELILIGMGNYIEMWNPQLFEEHQIDDSEEYSALAQKYLDE
ncbi:MAG: division/cell wall cluster transcriptional repressor MraZ [Marinoscillum sp.]|uniref:division/cell wall cluster transcriptional repressor MraZ n=1 Tax=Marinoscillum sp. TaxID=2024838 RepID=UPI0032F87C19